MAFSVNTYVFDEERHALVGSSAQPKPPRLRRLHPSQLYFKRTRHDALAEISRDQLAEQITLAFGRNADIGRFNEEDERAGKVGPAPIISCEASACSSSSCSTVQPPQLLYSASAAAHCCENVSANSFVRLAGRDNTDVVPTAVETGHLMLYTASAETLITP